jgi:hypothetical protein
VTSRSNKAEGATEHQLESFVFLVICGPLGRELQATFDGTFHVLGKATGAHAHVVLAGDERVRDEFLDEAAEQAMDGESSWDHDLERFGGSRQAAIHTEESIYCRHHSVEVGDLPSVIVFCKPTPPQVAGEQRCGTGEIARRSFATAFRCLKVSGDHFWAAIMRALDADRVAVLIAEINRGKASAEVVAAELLNDLLSELVFEGEVRHGLNELEVQILSFLISTRGSRVMSSGIAEEVGREVNGIGRELSRLCTLGLIENPGRQGYAVTELGMAVMQLPRFHKVAIRKIESKRNTRRTRKR